MVTPPRRPPRTNNTKHAVPPDCISEIGMAPLAAQLMIRSTCGACARGCRSNCARPCRQRGRRSDGPGATFHYGIDFVERREHADAPHARALLRAPRAAM